MMKASGKQERENNAAAVSIWQRLRAALPGALLYLALSFVLMLLITRSSFLYPYNNWDDANSYLSMGKSMFHGTVIYRDLFDQKGPYLYFFYGLASLISHTDFTGVFLMEVLFGAIDLWLIRRILRLYCRESTSLILTPILFACMCASKSFYWGGSAEEFCLPFLLYPLFLLLRTLEEGNLRYRERRAAANGILKAATNGSTKASSPMRAASFSHGKAAAADGTTSADSASGGGHASDSETGREIHFADRDVFAAGLCCGVVFCIKFTLMGFYLAFAIVVILTCRSRKEFLHLAGCYALGILLPFVPWVVYFALNGALDDWYRVYIYTNVFIYSNFGENSHGETIAQRIYDLAKILYWLVLDNYQHFLFIIAGMGWMLLRRAVHWVSRIAPILLFGLTFFFIYVGGATLSYYAIPLTIFAVCGMGALGKLIDRIEEWAGIRIHRADAALCREADDSACETMENAAASGKVPEQGPAAPAAYAAPKQNVAASAVDEPRSNAAVSTKPASWNAGGGRSSILTGILTVAAVMLSLVISYHYSLNTYYLSYEKEDVFLSQFAADIEADREAGRVDAGDTTLLNIGCLDCGLYTYADIYPTCYWFQTQTLPIDDVTEEQLRYITEAQVDYVVARDTYPDQIFDHYELIDSYHQVMGTQEFDYYLFRKVES